METHIAVILLKDLKMVKEFTKNLMEIRSLAFGKMISSWWGSSDFLMEYILGLLMRIFYLRVKVSFNGKRMVTYTKARGKMDSKMAGEHLKMIQAPLLVLGAKVWNRRVL